MPIIVDLNSSLGACNEIARRTPGISVAIFEIKGATPDVDTVIRRLGRLSPRGCVNVSIEVLTARQFNNGSPCPIKTMCESRDALSDESLAFAISTCSMIDDEGKLPERA
jgi:hypothetical protein